MELAEKASCRSGRRSAALVVGSSAERRLGVWRWLVLGAAVGVLLSGKAEAQHLSKHQHRARRETNASRQARIQRTIENTYSHQWEVFGGGGYLRWRSGENTQKNNEVSWAAGANYFLSPKFSVVGDAQGSFGRAHPVRFNPDVAPLTNPQINEYLFTGGANYRFYAKEKVAVSVQGTGGVAWGVFSSGSPQRYYAPDYGLWADGFKPAFTASVNVDYNFFPNLAVRFAPTYVGTTFGGDLQNNLGFNAGVVYRFGRRR